MKDYKHIGNWKLRLALMAFCLQLSLVHSKLSTCMAQEPEGEQAAVEQQNVDILQAFVENNPKTVDFDIIYAGTKLMLSADDDYLLVNLSVAHPALQMRLLMQPTKIYIDPVGKKGRKYEVQLPSAFDVKDSIQAPEEREGMTAGVGGEMERPDILPLIVAMNKKGAEWHTPKGGYKLGFQNFYIDLDQENAIINFYVLLPKSVFMEDPKMKSTWSAGIISENTPGFGPSPDDESSEQRMPPQMGNGGQEDMMGMMQADIRSWTRFSIDEVNNVNN